MDDKRELNDILIGGDDGRSNQSKKVMFLIAGIVVLIIAIITIIISMLNNNKPETIVLNKGQENVDIAIPQDSNMLNNIPINESEEDKFEKIVEEIKSQYQQNSTPTEKSQEVSPKATIPVKKPEKIPQAVPQIKQQKAPKQQIRVVNRSNNGDIATSGYYLQVGAFSKAPNKDFIDKIDAYGYRIQEILINSKVITRYLIGPYKSRAEAQKDFANIARDIATPIYLQIQ